MNQKKRKKRKLRTWVKVAIGILIVLLLWLFVRSVHQASQKKNTTHTESTEQYVVDTDVSIIIDPGHGGMDGGAVSSSNKSEKDLTLEYALQIGEDIKKLNPNIEVSYTHTTDEIPWENVNSLDYALDDLNGRMNLVNDQDPDYVLSIHFNSRDDKSEYGYESYVRGDDVASDTIYKYIVNNLDAIPWSKNNGCWSTEGYPLQMVDMIKAPSMLIELGFLTNDKEAKELENSELKDKICMAIAKAYCQYIAEHPEATQRQDVSKNPNVIPENLPDNLKSEEMKKEEAKTEETKSEEANTTDPQS